MNIAMKSLLTCLKQWFELRILCFTSAETPDEVLTEIRENVTKSLKRYFVLEFLKSALGIEADEAEVNEYLKTRQGIIDRSSLQCRAGETY